MEKRLCCKQREEERMRDTGEREEDDKQKDEQNKTFSHDSFAFFQPEYLEHASRSWLFEVFFWCVFYVINLHFHIFFREP